MGIEYNDGPCGRFENDFVGMRLMRVVHHFLGHLAAKVGSRDQTRGPIGGGEIVEKPDGIADLEFAGCDGGFPVDVEFLQSLSGLGGAIVEGRQLYVRSEDVRDGGKQFRMSVEPVEFSSFVDQIGEPVGSLFFGMADTSRIEELVSSLVALFRKELFQPFANGFQLGVIQQSAERKVALLVEGVSF